MLQRFIEHLLYRLSGLDHQLNLIHERLSKMATRDDLNVAITALGTELTQAITDLEAKIAVVAPAEDFSAEISKLKGFADQLTAVDPVTPASPVTPDPTSTTP